MILGITPARGGSKGIPRKNIRELAGKPLLGWTIEAALASLRIDRYVVSTEDDTIADVARTFGAEVIERPPDLAQDQSDTLPVLQHVLKSFEEAETVVLLQATSPIRSKGLVDECIKRFISTNSDSLATGFNCKYMEYATNDLPRQEIEGFFYDDGNVYVMRADLVRKGDRYGKRIEKYFVSKEENIDIDDPFDFWVAEKILNEMLKTEMM